MICALSLLLSQLKQNLSYLLEVTVPVARRLLISTRDNNVLKKRRKKRKKKENEKKEAMHVTPWIHNNLL